jgi:pimeloyl-ACP methyl ester carboxylesterase
MGVHRVGRALAAANGIRIFCRDTGSSLPAILCLHGRWGRGETWIDFMERYMDRYRIIAPDQRGHGLSDKPGGGYAAEDFARDAYELVAQLDCLPIVIVGHSMGGRVGAYLAALYPEAVRGVAILDEQLGDSAAGSPPGGVESDDNGLTRDWPTPYATIAEALRDLRARFTYESNVRYFAESLTETLDGYDFLFSRRAMNAIARACRGWRDILGRIECPVLIVRAAESRCLSKEEADTMQSIARNCTFFEVSGSDHMVYADNAEEFYGGFDEWLRRL